MGLVVYLEGLMSIFLKTNESAYHRLAGLLRGPVVSRLTWWYLEAVLSVILKSISITYHRLAGLSSSHLELVNNGLFKVDSICLPLSGWAGSPVVVSRNCDKHLLEIE